MAEPTRKRNRSYLIAFTALFIALTGGVAWGANTVSSLDIINGEVKSVDIGTGQVKTPDLAPANVTEAKLADGAVTLPKLADGAIDSAKVLDNSLTGTDVANANSLRSPEIGGLTGADIDEATLFNDNSLTAADIADAAITIPKLNFDPATQAELDAAAGAGGGWGLGGNSGTTGSDFLGTTDNQPLELRVNGARALRLEPASDGTNPAPSVIGGSADNSVTAGVHAATIGGGGRSTPSDPTSGNAVTDDLGTVGGGGNNQAGDGNGGSGDRAAATVGGGAGNLASGLVATVAGGEGNVASGAAATVGGGAGNKAEGDTSFAAGSGAQAQDNGSFVWADAAGFSFNSTAQNQFSVRATGGSRFVSGVGFLGSPISGVEFPAGTSALGALAGQPLDLRVDDARALRIFPASDGTNESPNLIGGTASNSVSAGVHSAVIGGGGRGTPADPSTANRVTDHQGTVGGGANNQAGDAAGTIGDSTLATVGGGGNNVASAEAATVSGGFLNTASGKSATVPGGDDNLAQGEFSFAAGRDARAMHRGAFVWADSHRGGFFGLDPIPFQSTAQDQFSVRAVGGARFVTAVNGSSGDPTAGVELAPGAGSWSSLSDEASKTAIDPISGRSVLRELADVPISEWSYRAQDESIRHIGPMAQDFYRAFDVGESRRRISSVDADGVALAAIKGLSQRLLTERRRRYAQERRLDRLEARLAALERSAGSR